MNQLPANNGSGSVHFEQSEIGTTFASCDGCRFTAATWKPCWNVAGETLSARLQRSPPPRLLLLTTPIISRWLLAEGELAVFNPAKVVSGTPQSGHWASVLHPQSSGLNPTEHQWVVVEWHNKHSLTNSDETLRLALTV